MFEQQKDTHYSPGESGQVKGPVSGARGAEPGEVLCVALWGAVGGTGAVGVPGDPPVG